MPDFKPLFVALLIIALSIASARIQLPRTSWPVRIAGAVPWLFVWYAVFYVLAVARC